jgi:UDP-3-O-[3-hydroxymyristoyl] N-acetylglucosamine deacetylase
MCLHTGEPGAVALGRTDGPLEFDRSGVRVGRGDLAVVRSDRGVAVRLGDEGPVVDLVEHLFSALAAHGIHEGLRVTYESPEVPLLGGGAVEFCRALVELDAPPSRPMLTVSRSATLSHGESVYRFEPGSDVHVDVVTVFPPPFGVQTAEWPGDSASFDREIASARTFGFAREREDLRRAGRARHVDPAAVMIFDAEGRVIPPGRPISEGELARHKLLDLVGDLYLYGGPPMGRIHAERPGHSATHAILARALREGVVVAGTWTTE